LEVKGKLNENRSTYYNTAQLLKPEQAAVFQLGNTETACRNL